MSGWYGQNLAQRNIEQLIMGTAAQESQMGRYLKQLNGPALGPFQMEPFTFNDLYDRLVKTHAGVEMYIFRELGKDCRFPDAMKYNLAIATVMCRLKYLSIKANLPKEDDVEGMAAYWKKYYNTPKGKGDPVTFVQNYNVMVKQLYK